MKGSHRTLTRFISVLISALLHMLFVVFKGGSSGMKMEMEMGMETVMEMETELVMEMGWGRGRGRER